jgi:ADP-ribosylation factor-like protein 8
MTYNYLPLTRYVVDSADTESLPIAREELESLLEKPSLKGIPLLVLGSKCDYQERLSGDELVEGLHLQSFTKREVQFYEVSSKEGTNVNNVLNWLCKRAR